MNNTLLFETMPDSFRYICSNVSNKMGRKVRRAMMEVDININRIHHIILLETGEFDHLFKFTKKQLQDAYKKIDV